MHFELAVATPSGFEPDASMIALGSTRDDIYFGARPARSGRRRRSGGDRHLDLDGA